MKDLFDLIAKFNSEYFKGWKENENVYYSNAIAGECGELCNLVKKLYGGGTNNKISIASEDLFKECADIFIYLALFLMKNDVYGDMFKEIVINKLDENYKRMEGLLNDE